MSEATSVSLFPINGTNSCLQFDLKGALMRALGGGLSGAAAMLLQVLLLMVCYMRRLHSIPSRYLVRLSDYTA